MVAVLACWDGRGGHAADPQPYQVTIAPTGDAAVDTAARDAATLVSLHDAAPVGPFALVARARGDMARFTAVLDGYGYYDGRVAITIAGRNLDDPALPDLLDATPSAAAVAVAVTLRLGPLYHVRHVALTGDVPSGAADALALPAGAPARAADVLAARDRLLAALLAQGHALATVGAPVAVLDPAAQALDVSLDVHAGPRVDLGPIAVDGLARVDAAFVRRRLLIRSGEPFDPGAIEKARADLASVGVFSSVRITAADRLDPAGTLPIDVTVTERPRHVVALSATYATDLGGSLSASWTHRNLFGGAEKLTLSAAATELGGTAAKQPGYNVGATLAFPDWLARDQTLTLSTQAIREYLDAYDRTAALVGATVARKLDPELTVSVGVTGGVSRIAQEDVTRTYTLVQLPLGATFDNTGSLFDPTHGARASATVTPTLSLGRPGGAFVIAEASASTYVNLAAPGRSVLALRALIGTVQGASTFAIPPDQRFYGGGSATVRGYRFQSIGPQFADGKPVGGTAIDAASIEFRQRFGESWGAVAFADAGQVATGAQPFTAPVRVGVGLGARYYTPIGPIRIDIAVPVHRERKGDILEAYIGIGQAF